MVVGSTLHLNTLLRPYCLSSWTLISYKRFLYLAPGYSAEPFLAVGSWDTTRRGQEWEKQYLLNASEVK